MANLYKIKFSKSPEKLNEDYELLSDIDKEKISNMEAEAFFELEEEGKYTFYVLVEVLNLRPYLNVLNENKIEYKIKNISSEILLGNFDIEIELKKYVKSNFNKKYIFFIGDINEWIYNNLDMDSVLDRISKVGIKNLRKVEQDYLNNYNKI